MHRRFQVQRLPISTSWPFGGNDLVRSNASRISMTSSSDFNRFLPVHRGFSNHQWNREEPPRPRMRTRAADINEGRTNDRQWAVLLATSGQVRDRLRAGSHGRRHTSVPTLGHDEAIPDEHEMWSMAWALYFIGKSPYAALPLVMGGAGLRIGECCDLRRRDCMDGPKNGMWISVRGILASPGTSWTDSGLYAMNAGGVR